MNLRTFEWIVLLESRFIDYDMSKYQQLAGLGYYRGNGMSDKWIWDTSKLKSMSNDELEELYNFLIINKHSWEEPK